jgi:hypothetical protein
MFYAVRPILTTATIAFVLMMLFAVTELMAQETGPQPIITSYDLSAQEIPFPDPSDILTPNTRRNTPYLKIGVRAGFNISSYTNDRYLNNVQLDVGQVSGESAIYTAATGFGYQAGVDVEYPFNTGLSLLLTGEYAHVRFGGEGPVNEPCVTASGTERIGTSLHDFMATIDYVKLAASSKFSFSSFYLTIGIAAGIPASTSLERIRSFSGSDCFFPNSGNQTVLREEGGIPDPNRIHYSLRTGLGLIYQWSHDLQFAPELTLDFGFNTVNKSPNSDLGVYGISGTLRYDL